jgi:hypothetical protein
LDPTALRRLIRSSVGKAWGDVFAAIKERFSSVTASYADETLGQSWGIAIKTSLKNGQVRVHAGTRVQTLEESSLEYYVHPESGVLMENAFIAAARRREREREESRKTELAARMREISPELQLHKVSGKWFAVELQALESSDRATHFDAVLNRSIPFTERDELHKLYGRRNVIGRRKRELQYRELRELQLTNA